MDPWQLDRRKCVIGSVLPTLLTVRRAPLDRGDEVTRIVVGDARRQSSVARRGPYLRAPDKQLYARGLRPFDLGSAPLRFIDLAHGGEGVADLHQHPWRALCAVFE